VGRVVFALSHLVKAGIESCQNAAIFLTGSRYGWVRLDCAAAIRARSL